MTLSKDERIVARQLGRRPKPFLDVCRRCRYDYPQVIFNRPVTPRENGFDVLPTVYWLTCPLLNRAISRLEAEGQIRMYEQRLQSEPELFQRMKQEHEAAAAARVEQVPRDVKKQLQEEQPRQWAALADTGIAGIRSAEGVKCLHAHFADYVGRGTNPIGKEVEEQLRQRGVAVDGDDECWRHCTVDEPAASARQKVARRAIRNGARP